MNTSGSNSKKEQTVEPELFTFYVTYGNNTNLAKNYSVVKSKSESQARLETHQGTGGKWAFLYKEADFQGQAEKFGLTEIPLQQPVRMY